MQFDDRLVSLNQSTALACLEIDTREHPLEAPAGTPSPLQEAFDAVARALFEAAELRRSPPTSPLLLRIAADALVEALSTATKYHARAETWSSRRCRS